MAEVKLSELGLAEFVAGLISETFEAMSASMADQLARQTDLLRAADMDEASYGQRYVDESAVDQACMVLFGDDQGRHPLVAGGIYVPGEEAEEQPPVQRQCGLVLREEKDFTKSDSGGFVFTAVGIERVRQELRRQLAQQHQQALRLALNKGLPRLLIDSGRILAKVTFNLSETTAGTADSNTPASASSPAPLKASGRLDASVFQSSLLNRLSLTRTNLLLPNTQLKVKPAADDTAQSSTSSVYGEVEITFKTVN